MNTKLLLGVGVVVVVVAIGAFLVMKKPSDNGTNGATPPSASGSQKGSLKSLLAMGTPQKCTYSDTQAGAHSTGTVMVSGGKMRGDFTSVAANGTTHSHMSVMNDTSYMWTDEMSEGFKMAFSQTQSQTSQSNSVDVNKDVDYSCTPWSTDDSQFQLPAGITFSDMTSVMPSGAKTPSSAGTPSGSSSQCGACDQLQEPSRTQCRLALSCK